MALEIVRTIVGLRARIAEWRAAGDTVGLVPTMGALHRGHASLVELSRRHCRRTVATLFVNPKQFGPREDFARYPRTEDNDRDVLAAAGADLVFAPPTDVVYPTGFATRVDVSGIGDILEGQVRPGFFAGVATVVAKLLLQALPDRAFFGEKDYQQLLVIRRLVKDLDIPVAIEGGPTIRDRDGLALSSRNAYLSAAERAQAPALHAALVRVATRFKDGVDPDVAGAEAKTELFATGFAFVDYLDVRDAETLAAIQPGHCPARVLGAARLGTTRLIDNVAV